MPGDSGIPQGLRRPCGIHVQGGGQRLGRWSPKEGFPTFHAFLEAFGTYFTEVGVSTRKDDWGTIASVEFLITNHAMQRNLRRKRSHTAEFNSLHFTSLQFNSLHFF
jgi:hypothetical protein